MFPPFIKTPICSNMHNCRGTCFAVTPPTLSPITGTLGGAATAVTGMEYIRVYSAIAVSVYINIVYK